MSDLSAGHRPDPWQKHRNPLGISRFCPRSLNDTIWTFEQINWLKNSFNLKFLKERYLFKDCDLVIIHFLIWISSISHQFMIIISFQPLTTCILPLRFGWTIWCAIPGAQSRCFPGMLFYEVSTMLACFCLRTERCTRNLVSIRGLTGVKVQLKEQVLRFHVMEFDYDTLLQNAQTLFFYDTGLNYTHTSQLGFPWHKSVKSRHRLPMRPCEHFALNFDQQKFFIFLFQVAQEIADLEGNLHHWTFQHRGGGLARNECIVLFYNGKRPGFRIDEGIKVIASETAKRVTSRSEKSGVEPSLPIHRSLMDADIFSGDLWSLEGWMDFHEESSTLFSLRSHYDLVSTRWLLEREAELSWCWCFINEGPLPLGFDSFIVENWNQVY